MGKVGSAVGIIIVDEILDYIKVGNGHWPVFKFSHVLLAIMA